MHFIQGQTHAGTHVEGCYKYSETGADMASMPLESYLGEAAACNFTAKKAGEAVTAEDFRRAGVKSGDIVLAWGSRETVEDPPYMTVEVQNRRHYSWRFCISINCLVFIECRLI